MRGQPARHHTGAVPILMYHSIAASAAPAFHRYTLDPALFREHLDHLAEHGYRTVTVSQVAEQWRAGVTPAHRTVALTFDDGFADFHSAVLPALRRHGFTATLYVTTGYLDGTSRWLAPEGEADRPMLTWTQLQEIVDAGVECAAHSEAHPRLDEVPATRVRQELVRPKAVLEQRLQVAVHSFAYPYGYYSRRVRTMVQAAGYRSACAVNELAATAGDHPWALPRMSVDAGTDAAGLARLLDQGGSGPTGRGVVEAKRLLWQALRRGGLDGLAARAAAAVPSGRGRR